MIPAVRFGRLHAAALILIWIGAASLPLQAFAQEKPLTDKAQQNIKAEAFALDLAVPSSPAFTVLGLSPDRVARPTSPRELATDLLNGVDDQGNLQTGLAIDFVPYLLIAGDELTLAQYRQNDFGPIGLRRLAARSQLSLATTKGTSDDDKSVRLAAGLHVTPWDTGDARMNLTLDTCINAVHDEILASMGQFSPNLRNLIIVAYDWPDDDDQWSNKLEDLVRKDGVEQVERDLHARIQDATRKARLVATAKAFKVPALPKDEDVQKLEIERRLADLERDLHEKITSKETFLDWQARLEKCFADAKLQNWNAAAWDLGIAPSWVSESSGFQDLGHAGGTLWTSLSLDLPGNNWWGLTGEPEDLRNETDVHRFIRQHFQAIGHVRYRWDQRVDDPSSNNSTQKVQEDDLLVGGRLRAGVPSLALSVEGAYVREKPKGMPAINGQRWAASGEIKITDSFWLQVSAGANEGIGGTNDGFVLGSIRYGLSTESPFAAWPAL